MRILDFPGCTITPINSIKSISLSRYTDIDDIDVDIDKLTLERHAFELCRSTYTQTFFGKYEESKIIYKILQEVCSHKHLFKKQLHIERQYVYNQSISMFTSSISLSHIVSLKYPD